MTSPSARLIKEAFEGMPTSWRLALETADLLWFPRNHVTSKGAVDRSMLRRFPPASLQVCGTIPRLQLLDLSEQEQDAIILEMAQKDKEFWAAIQREQPVSATARAANTASLLANLNLKLEPKQ